jgi:cell division septation protein DedD
MKKWLLAAAALVFFVGASVWEGSAAVGLNGELPEGGFFVATKSFPRNTVVDITNLETGKTIRAIVASALDSPGLLAVISREAAEVIGLQNRSVGRVRMTMPSDPVAFSRFTEGLGSNGDPDFDPRASVAVNSAGAGSPAAPPPPMSALEGTYPDPWTLAGSPAYPDPWARENTAESLTNDANKYGDPYTEPVPVDGEPYAPPAARRLDDSVVPEPVPALAWVSPESAQPTPLAEPRLIPEVFNPLPSIQSVIGVGEEPESPYPPVSTEIAGFPENAQYPAPTLADPYGFSLIPAPARPPEGPASALLPPEAEIPPLGALSLSPAPADDGDFYLDPALFVDPIPEAAATAESEIAPLEEPETPAGPPAAALADQGAPAEPERFPAEVFSVPLVSRLEGGKYYVQLGAFSRPEVVESELSRIGLSYPLTVQAGGSPEKPLYRILLGPVNLGESGALLQRFRGNGFEDAFIRQTDPR